MSTSLEDKLNNSPSLNKKQVDFGQGSNDRAWLSFYKTPQSEEVDSVVLPSFST